MEENDDLSEVERIRQKYMHLITPATPAKRDFSASKSSKKLSSEKSPHKDATDKSLDNLLYTLKSTKLNLSSVQNNTVVNRE